MCKRYRKDQKGTFKGMFNATKKIKKKKLQPKIIE
jgi:hypothetical protein